MSKAKTKAKARDLADMVNGALGAGTMIMGSDPSLVVEYIPTGVLPIDILTGGGIPKGRYTEIYGDYSTLKSYVGYSLIAQVQMDGGTAALIDTEGAYDPAWAASIGVDLDELILPPTDTGEEAIDASQLLMSEGIDLIVWDSIAATLPKAEANVRMGGDKNTQPARQAAMMSQALRKLTATNRNTAVLCINQTRSKVGIVFGSPESVPGGKALPYYASFRIAIRKVGKITTTSTVYDGEKDVTSRTTTGQKFRAELLKSKLSAPDKEVYFTWDLKEASVDDTGYLMAQGLEIGLVTYTKTGKNGVKTWRIKGSQKTFRGDKVFRGYLDKTPKMKHRIREAALAGVRPADKSKDA